LNTYDNILNIWINNTILTNHFNVEDYFDNRSAQSMTVLNFRYTNRLLWQLVTHSGTYLFFYGADIILIFISFFLKLNPSHDNWCPRVGVTIRAQPVGSARLACYFLWTE